MKGLVGKSDTKKPFGNSVRVWRDRLGISQETLAERAGLHRTYISDVERGSRNVTLASIEKLADALEVSVPSLLSYARESLPKNSLVPPPSENELVNILLVEDGDDDVELTMQAFRSAHFTNRIEVVRDGAAALNYCFCTGEFTDRGPGQHPQLILLDLGLPRIDGLEVLRRLKANPRTHKIPVVVLTASSRDRDISRCIDLGAAAYLVKPMDFQNLSKITPKLSLQWALLQPAPAMRL